MATTYPVPVRIEGFLFKVEATYGTDPTPSASTDGIRVMNQQLWTSANPEYAFPNTREDALSPGRVDPAMGIPGGRMVEFEIETEIKGAGAAYSSSTPVRPEMDPLLMCAGFSRTHDDTGSSESVTYTLIDQGEPGGTAYIYAGGKLLKVHGCRCAPVFVISAGEQARVRWRIQGFITADETETDLASITYDSVQAPAVKAIGLAIVPSGGSSWTPAVAGLEIDGAYDMVRLDDVNAADGIEGFFIDRQNPRVRMQPRVVALSDYNPQTRSLARTDHTIDLTIGSTPYNQFTVDINAAALEGYPGRGEDNRRAAWDLVYKARDLTLVFD